MQAYFALFDTAIGRCGLAWGERGIVGVQLPEANARKTRGRLLQRFPQAREAEPAAEVKRAVDGIVAMLGGGPSDLSKVPLDMSLVPPFHRHVYDAARNLPRGTTTTYGALAEQIGAQGAARAVGQALARNPFALIVPCHRVVASNGRMGGFSADGGITTKLRLLAIEGAAIDTYRAENLSARREKMRVAIGGLFFNSQASSLKRRGRSAEVRTRVKPRHA
jgi:methylated-DNA-[protein]-cysteine S-methyltransferase